MTGFSVVWLGLWMAQIAPLQILLPNQVGIIAADSEWIRTVMAFGIVAGVGGVLAIVVYPVAGALSDRTVSRFGRRRPWIAGGVLLFAVGLALTGIQTTLVGMAITWALAVVGFCVASAALTAVVSDQVPVSQRGVISSGVAGANAIGTVLGVALVGLIITQQELGYLVIAVLLVVCTTPFLVRMRDEPLTAGQARLVASESVTDGARIGVNLRAHPDYTWALASRILVYLGNALGTALLLYYFGFALKIADAEDFLVNTILIYVAVTLLVAVFGGNLSDRLGKRKAFVLVGGVAQGLAAALLAFVPSPPMALVAAALLGFGWGAFLSVDQAVSTQVLPDAESRGKYLGVMNIAVAVPQNVGPLLGAIIVALTGGFVWLFVLSALALVAGGLAILRVRSLD